MVKKKTKQTKNNIMDISSDKEAKTHTRRLGHGYERKTWKEKLNLFY